MFDFISAFSQGGNARLLGAFFSIGMFILTMVRFIRSTGTRFGVALTRHVEKGVSWTPYADVPSRLGLRLAISNQGQMPAAIADVWLEAKGMKGKFRPEPYKKALDLELPVGEGRSYFVDLDGLGISGDHLVRAVVRDSGKGLHRSQWLAVRIPPTG